MGVTESRPTPSPSMHTRTSNAAHSLSHSHAHCHSIRPAPVLLHHAHSTPLFTHHHLLHLSDEQRNQHKSRASSDGQVVYYTQDTTLQQPQTAKLHRQSQSQSPHCNSNSTSSSHCSSSNSASSPPSILSAFSSLSSSASSTSSCHLPCSPASQRSQSTGSVPPKLSCNNCGANCNPTVCADRYVFCSKDCYWSYSFRHRTAMAGCDWDEEEEYEGEEEEESDWYTAFRKDRVKLSSSICDEEVSVPDCIKYQSTAPLGIRRVVHVLPPLHA